jgi:pilus assembly protein CpaE
MRKTTSILLTGHGEAHLEVLRQLASPLSNVDVISKNLDGVGLDQWPELALKADVLIHFLGVDAEQEMKALSRLPAKDRPATLIVYDRGEADISLMRLAMQAGARDFIMGSQVTEDALAALRKILKEDRFNYQPSERALTAVVNAKGGCGASTIAYALSHALVSRHRLHCLLMDMDFQFGSQNLKQDAHPEQGILEALNATDTLDEIALMGYVSKHSSGLHVLSATVGDIILPGEVDVVRLRGLIEIVQQYYEHIVTDMPRLIDPVFNLVMEKADHVIVVLQQDISSLRDAQRMIRIMASDLGVSTDIILPVINRYEPSHVIGIADVERTLAVKSVHVVPNDYKRVFTAANLGVPIAEHAPKSPSVLSIGKLADLLAGKKMQESTSGIGALLGRFMAKKAKS